MLSNRSTPGRGRRYTGLRVIRWVVENNPKDYTQHLEHNESLKSRYTGRFIMFSVITNIYNKKSKGPTLMELFTVTGKLKKFFWTTKEV
jgi:hypothetical protein